MEKTKDMLITMPVGRLLLKFSLPAIGGMIVNSLYNLVDRIFVGRIGGLAMTGIGLSLPFMLILSAVSSLVGIGASALISIKLGENNKNEANISTAFMRFRGLGKHINGFDILGNISTLTLYAEQLSLQSCLCAPQLLSRPALGTRSGLCVRKIRMRLISFDIIVLSL